VEGWPELAERRPLGLNRNHSVGLGSTPPASAMLHHEPAGPAGNPQETSLLETFLKCRQVLSRFIGRVVAPGDIEDIVQETFIRSMQAGVVRRIDHPKAFMFRTARNLAFNHVQRLDNKARPHMLDFLDEETQPATETLEAQFESQERFDYFCRAINQLPVKCRRAFILRKIYGLTQKEVAKFLEMTEGNVEKHVSRGLTRCIEYMNGIDGFEHDEDDGGGEPGARIRGGAVR
jgi:RNA polymerase sigma factor (sigma-70 family)